jgi:hypothetical protein
MLLTLVGMVVNTVIVNVIFKGDKMETIREVYDFIQFGKQTAIHNFEFELKRKFDIKSFEMSIWGSIYVYGHKHCCRIYENGEISTEFVCDNKVMPETVEEFMKMKEIIDSDRLETEAAARYVINVLRFNKEDQ